MCVCVWQCVCDQLLPKLSRFPPRHGLALCAQNRELVPPHAGEFIGAEEAARIGLASRVVPHGELLAEARRVGGSTGRAAAQLLSRVLC